MNVKTLQLGVGHKLHPGPVGSTAHLGRYRTQSSFPGLWGGVAAKKQMRSQRGMKANPLSGTQGEIVPDSITLLWVLIGVAINWGFPKT